MFLTHLFLHTNTFEKRIFWSLAALACLGAFWYGYFVQATIVATAERIDIEENVRKINAEIGSQEAVYSELRSHLTFESARTLGFATPQAQLYAVRTRLVENAR